MTPEELMEQIIAEGPSAELSDTDLLTNKKVEARPREATQTTQEEVVDDPGSEVDRVDVSGPSFDIEVDQPTGTTGDDTSVVEPPPAIDMEAAVFSRGEDSPEVDVPQSVDAMEPEGVEEVSEPQPPEDVPVVADEVQEPQPNEPVQSPEIEQPQFAETAPPEDYALGVGTEVEVAPIQGEPESQEVATGSVVPEPDGVDVPVPFEQQELPLLADFDNVEQFVAQEHVPERGPEWDDLFGSSKSEKIKHGLDSFMSSKFEDLPPVGETVDDRIDNSIRELDQRYAY